ncbi:hypothetical protein KP509_12G006800 [Ceratopteris richardii]|uniref:Secreted protein n=1 Tax=Ceratopteris richardii TaxID=49495 RepID=A0A8T2TGH4_CERRI|nr:hypothetical protein KP509_12G006800 [Ceratopteris richardii]
MNCHFVLGFYVCWRLRGSVEAQSQGQSMEAHQKVDTQGKGASRELQEVYVKFSEESPTKIVIFITKNHCKYHYLFLVTPFCSSRGVLELEEY